MKFYKIIIASNSGTVKYNQTIGFDSFHEMCQYELGIRTGIMIHNEDLPYEDKLTIKVTLDKDGARTVVLP